MRILRYIAALILVVISLIPILSNAEVLPDVSGCTTASFVSGTDANVITIVGTTYSPKCLKLKVGATVTILASRHHPLMAMADINGKQNPFADGKLFDAAQTRIMDRAGLFGYYCDNHGSATGNGMAGAILVEQ
ncbi:MAG: hypothetical protein AABY53_07050 [Bdellovibrionota bacterium]